jgi:hypothetical protein
MTDAEDREIALERLASFAAPDVEPTLSVDELEDILDQSARGTRWNDATDFAVGTVVIPTANNGHVYVVTVGGTTGATEPTWPESMGGTVVDNEVEFEEAGLYYYSSLYDVRGALRKAWELKAAKASELISSADSGSEQMIFQQCQRMIEHYTTPVIA